MAYRVKTPQQKQAKGGDYMPKDTNKKRLQIIGRQHLKSKPRRISIRVGKDLARAAGILEGDHVSLSWYDSPFEHKMFMIEKVNLSKGLEKETGKIKVAKTPGIKKDSPSLYIMFSISDETKNLFSYGHTIDKFNRKKERQIFCSEKGWIRFTTPVEFLPLSKQIVENRLADSSKREFSPDDTITFSEIGRSIVERVNYLENELSAANALLTERDDEFEAKESGYMQRIKKLTEEVNMLKGSTKSGSFSLSDLLRKPQERKA